MYQPMGELNEAIALITKRGKSCKTYVMRLEKPDVTARSQRGRFPSRNHLQRAKGMTNFKSRTIFHPQITILVDLIVAVIC